MKNKTGAITSAKRLWSNVSRFTFHVSRRGFSLIEVLIFATIFSLFFVAASSIVTLTVRNLLISQHKILATRYAQELEEWLKGEQEKDFDAFKIRSSLLPGTTYCFNGGLAWPASAGPCGVNDFSGVYNITGNPRIYKREVVLTELGEFNIKADITLSWKEGADNRIFTTKRTVFFTLAQ